MVILGHEEESGGGKRTHGDTWDMKEENNLGDQGCYKGRVE